MKDTGFGRLMHHLKLEQKIGLVLIVAFAVIVGIGLFEIRHVASVYDEEMYNMNIANMKGIMSELNGILDSVNVFGDYFVGDDVIQNNLVTVKDSDSPADGSVAKRNIVRRLNSLQGTVPFVKDISLSLQNGDLIHSGDGSSLPADGAADTDGLAVAAQGKVIWVSDDAKNVYYVRQIRRKEYLKLDTLAVVYLKLDLAGIIGEISARFGLDFPPNLSMYSGTRLLFSSFRDTSNDMQFLNAALKDDTKYSFETINGNKYFVTCGYLPGSSWRYVHYLDYQSLSTHVSSIVLKSILTLLAAMLLTLIVIHYILKHIIHHLQVLGAKMARFESGDTDMSGFPSYAGRPDEIGVVHQQFDKMVVRFNNIIQDNYVKQLIIKDNTIKMLSQQINPHFLYNVLDSIYWLAQGYGAEDIEQISYSLANLFRISISNDAVCVPLRRELEFLNHYIRIQTIRFTDRLAFRMNVPDDLLEVSVPKFSIQPLVENAVKHSMEVNDEPCTIVLTAESTQDKVNFHIANTGSSFDADIALRVRTRRIAQNGSIGLVNIDERLQLLFGPEYGLYFHNEGNMAVVSFAVPKGRFEMFKVLIVDDEDIVRNSLVRMIPWQELDCTVVAAARNGAEALHLVSDSFPDIIVTDIVMPVMDGLELIEKVRKLDDDVEFIVLSGYGEFNLAQKAMSFGVKYYLLKPTQKADLTEKIREVTDEIREKANRRKQEFRKLVAENRLYFLKGLILELLNNPSSADDVLKRNRSLLGLDGIDTACLVRLEVGKARQRSAVVAS